MASIFGVPAAGVAFSWRRPGAGQMVATIAVVAALFFVWIGGYRIVITEKTLYFLTLVGSSQVPRKAIRETHVTFCPSRYKAPLPLVVKYDGGGEIDINAKVFSREAIAPVLALAPRHQ